MEEKEFDLALLRNFFMKLWFVPVVLGLVFGLGKYGIHKLKPAHVKIDSLYSSSILIKVGSVFKGGYIENGDTTGKIVMNPGIMSKILQNGEPIINGNVLSLLNNIQINASSDLIEIIVTDPKREKSLIICNKIANYIIARHKILLKEQLKINNLDRNYCQTQMVSDAFVSDLSSQYNDNIFGKIDFFKAMVKGFILGLILIFILYYVKYFGKLI
jgi:hypothetical protein